MTFIKLDNFDSGSFKDVFFDAQDNLSEPARVVMENLINYTKYFDDKISTKEIARWQGRRDVVNRIIGMLNVKPQDVVMFRGKGEVDGLV